jgi:uroporphyrinogen decarboxylase
MLKREPTPRAVMFDFIIGADKEKLLTGNDYKVDTEFNRVVTTIKAFDSAGYDFSPIIVRGLDFVRKSHEQKNVLTKSLNEGATIVDRESFKKYEWPNIDHCDFSIIKEAGKYLHPDAKFIPFSLDGILENTIGITGFDNLCFLIYDDYDLVKDIFYEVGIRIE